MHGYGLVQPYASPLTHTFFDGRTVLPLVGLILLVVIGLVIWFAVRQTNTATTHGTHYVAPTSTPVDSYQQTPQGPVDPAESVVRDRFARGEINSEEYARLIATLRNQ